MYSDQRRQAIREILHEVPEPVKGSELAEKLGVSRQVIVQDIAILRAAGEEILATPQGYLIPERIEGSSTIRKTIVTRHLGNEDMDEELKIIVDQGGKIIDVIVEHPIYGEIRGNLMISTRHDVEEFMKRIVGEHAEPLSILTEGVHLHTIEVPDEETYVRIVEHLERSGYLLKDV
ncbi:MAG TPA: transcription repressor NadR [Synergistales bacterium]|nr:transcription repressor NadR [Synergistales bacterium]